jgi:surfeit locus 1 family protein
MKFITPFIVLLAFILLCSLSVWQLQRGLTKKALLSTQATQAQLPTLHNTDISTILKNPSRYLQRTIKLTGTFQNDRTILLDNKILNGQVGYEVITPLLIDSDHSLLINRGFVPMGASRKELPPIPPILKQITIKGHINIPHHNRFIKNSLGGTNFPIFIQELDFSLLQPLFETQLIPVLVQLSPDSPLSFEAMPEKKTWLNPEKHFAYALQWILLAFSLVIIYTRVYFVHKKSIHHGHPKTKS